MSTPMKNGLDAAAIKRIEKVFAVIDPKFPGKRFIETAASGIQDLELKQRVDFLVELLAEYLPENYEVSSDLLEQIPDHWDAGVDDDPLRSFAAWPIIDYAGRYGVNSPTRALKILKRLTPLFSAEFAIRPFLEQHTNLTLATLMKWCNEADDQVRRLVSEGTRPRLPWGQHLKHFIDDPQPVLALLEQLKDDPSEYVRRSVANNLNDIAKDHPQRVVDLCARWMRDANANRRWIIKHATRTLVKLGHPGVYRLLGFTEKPKISIASFSLNPSQLSVGDVLEFSFNLISEKSQSQSLVVDYAVHHIKANGKLSPKVFKLKNITLDKGEKLSITKKHSLRKITTRTYYPGQHIIEILINGKPIAQQEFMLLG